MHLHKSEKSRVSPQAANIFGPFRVRKADGDGRRECRTDAEAEGRLGTTAGRADTISALLEVGRYAASASRDRTSEVGGCFTCLVDEQMASRLESFLLY